MEYEQMLCEIKQLVKLQADKFSLQMPGGMNAWSGHIQIVEKYALLFAKQRNADEQIVDLSAILHDYARYLDSEKYEKIHAEKGADLAKEILSKYNYDSEKTKRVCENILHHDKDNQASLNSLEGICLADADGYCHIINCFEIYNAFKIIKNPKDTKESLEILLYKIDKSFEKLSDYGKDFAKADYVIITNYIKKAISSYQV